MPLLRIVMITLGALLLAAGSWLGIALKHTLPMPHPGTASAASPGVPLDASARRAVAPLLEAVPGFAVSVWAGDRIVWSQGFGFSDVEGRVPATPSTRFRIYSLSKPITAAAALCLAEMGRADLEAPISTVVPELRAESGAVSARQLMGHLAGIRDYRDGEWLRVSRAPCKSLDQALAPFIGDPLIHPPGEAFAYSSFGYVLLSAVLERASGLDFEHLLQETVLAPAGMRSTSIERADAGHADLASFYEPAAFGRIRRARSVDNSCKLGAGALLSTSDDLARFVGALLNGRLVRPESLASVFRTMKTRSGAETAYASGWGVGKDHAGREFALHRGGAIGGRGVLLVYPAEGIGVAILGNIDGPSMVAEAQQLAHIFFTPRP